jgi:hypothetical protein
MFRPANVALAAALAAAILAATALADNPKVRNQAADPPPTATSATWGTETRENANINDRISITNNWYAQPEVIYSVPLSHAISTSETLRVRGEVQLSYCTPTEVNNHACAQTYTYTPTASAKVIIAPSPTATTKVSGTQVVDWIDEDCSDREHHCPIAIPPANLGSLPSVGDTTDLYLNLIVAAHHGTPAAQDQMVVDVGQGKVDGLRLGQSRTDPDPLDPRLGSTDLVNDTIKIYGPNASNTDKRTIILRQRITNFAADEGDFIDVHAFLHAKPPAGDGREFGAMVILTPHQDQRVADGTDEDIVALHNGGNCHNSTDGCIREKSGVTVVPKQATDWNGTLFVNLIGTAVQNNPSGSFTVPPNDTTKLVTRIWHPAGP